MNSLGPGKQALLISPTIASNQVPKKAPKRSRRRIDSCPILPVLRIKDSAPQKRTFAEIAIDTAKAGMHQFSIANHLLRKEGLDTYLIKFESQKLRKLKSKNTCRRRALMFEEGARKVPSAPATKCARQTNRTNGWRYIARHYWSCLAVSYRQTRESQHFACMK